MKERLLAGCLVLSSGFIFLLSGCASSYYMVKDPQSNSVYYTQQIEDIKGGAVKLQDARTGSTVTIQNSEVKEIDSKTYKAALAAPAAAPAATASAPAPVVAPDAASATTPKAAETTPTTTAAPKTEPTTAPATAPALEPTTAPTPAPQNAY